VGDLPFEGIQFTAPFAFCFFGIWVMEVFANTLSAEPQAPGDFSFGIPDLFSRMYLRRWIPASDPTCIRFLPVFEEKPLLLHFDVFPTLAIDINCH
jgi:hypothetical protein